MFAEVLKQGFKILTPGRRIGKCWLLWQVKLVLRRKGTINRWELRAFMGMFTQQHPPQEVRIDSPRRSWVVVPTPRKHIAILNQSLGHHGVLTLIFLSPPSSQDQKAQLLWCFVTQRR